MLLSAESVLDSHDVLQCSKPVAKFAPYGSVKVTALASNNAFIMKLVKMWLGGGPHVVVGTLKISLDQFLFFYEHNHTPSGKKIVT